MNDLIDFFQAAKRDDDSFSLKGRSLPALRQRLKGWHRELREISCNSKWAGHDLPDSKYTTGSGCERAIWRFRQIRTGRDLVLEGRRMAHCVATYESRCISGEVSIWSLTRELNDGRATSGVTIELRRDGTIVQCRGFGNRATSFEEGDILARWARKFGLTWPVAWH